MAIKILSSLTIHKMKNGEAILYSPFRSKKWIKELYEDLSVRFPLSEYSFGFWLKNGKKLTDEDARKLLK